MTRAQRIALAAVGAALLIVVGAVAAVLVAKKGDEGSPVAATAVVATDAQGETVVVTETQVQTETTTKTKTVTTEAEATEPETVTVSETETQTETVEIDADVQILIDEISTQTAETYDSCQEAVDALLAATSAYDGSPQSYAELLAATAAAEAACAQAASDIEGQLDDAAETGYEQLEKALKKYSSLAEAQAAAVQTLDRALQSDSKRAAEGASQAYAAQATALQSKVKTASKSLKSARTGAGLPAQPKP